MERTSVNPQFDPSVTAVLAIDVQQGIFLRFAPVYNSDVLLNNINTLIDRFALAGRKDML
jgi:hypothetical protein